MIVQGSQVSIQDLAIHYSNSLGCGCVYFDTTKYNSLSTTKKTTVDTWYGNFMDDYMLDIIKQGQDNIVTFVNSDSARINAASWFPKEADCPDADHYIRAWVSDESGDIIWENTPPKSS